MAKCKNRGFYKGGVGIARRSDVRNRNLFSVEPVSTQMAQHVPQDDPTEAPKIGPRWVYIPPRWPNIGPKMAQHRPKRGPTWHNIGPRWAQDGPTTTTAGWQLVGVTID